MPLSSTHCASSSWRTIQTSGIRAVAGSIEGETDHSAFKSVLRHTTCNVCVVVLHPDNPCSSLLPRPFRGEVVGVKVVGDDFRADFENPLQVPDCLVEKTITFDIF